MICLFHYNFNLTPLMFLLFQETVEAINPPAIDPFGMDPPTRNPIVAIVMAVHEINTIL